MCIAIYKPAGTWAEKRELRECYERNPDGAGYAWHDGTRVHLRKGFFSWRKFWKSFKQNVTHETPAFIHFRIATRGTKDALHCHPFQMTGGVLMHNGPCLNHKYCAGNSERSDSRQFVEDFIDGLTSAQFKRLQPMIEDFAGTEKVAAMFDDGTVVLCNEMQGHWDHGVWWSNYSYKSYTSRSYAPTVNWSAWDESPYDEWDSTDTWRYKAPEGNSAKLVTATAKTMRVWSTKLARFVRASIHITDDVFLWDEEMSAYILKEYAKEPRLFPMQDEGVVYGPNDKGEYAEVGYLITTQSEYEELVGCFAETEAPSTAATA